MPVTEGEGELGRWGGERVWVGGGRFIGKEKGALSRGAVASASSTGVGGRACLDLNLKSRGGTKDGRSRVIVGVRVKG